MFSNRIVQVLTNDILIDRENRQRSNLTPDSVIDLAYSIGKNQWISPILIDESTNHVIAGERRLTAVKALHSCVNGDYSIFSKPEEARTKLAHICSCKVASWQDWSKIPSQLGKNLTEQELVVFEFIENAQRADLKWQDKAKAIYTIHAHGLATEKKWNNQQTGILVGLDHSSVAKCLKIWRFMIEAEAETDKNSPLKLIIEEANTMQSALQTIDRHVSRRQDDVVSLTSTAIAPKTKNNKDISSKPGPQSGIAPKLLGIDPAEGYEELGMYEEDSPFKPVTIGEQLILNENFNSWAEDYTGQPFNFLHCDFPYGISFNKGAQGNTVASKVTGNYNDNPDVYWDLLNTLVKHKDRLIAPSAHIMFWFSQNHRKATEDFFIENFPECIVQPFLMIWHCSDGSGILPDPQRYGRRTYETAMLITFGDRLINIPKSLSFSSPRETSTRIHRSQKPLAVLDHFFSMFVDESSRVLDPTAGSGTSLVVSYNLEAEKVIGLEMQSETYETAVKFIDEELAKDDIIL
jgi:hypothetical protein